MLPAQTVQRRRLPRRTRSTGGVSRHTVRPTRSSGRLRRATCSARGCRPAASVGFRTGGAARNVGSALCRGSVALAARRSLDAAVEHRAALMPFRRCTSKDGRSSRLLHSLYIVNYYWFAVFPNVARLRKHARARDEVSHSAMSYRRWHFNETHDPSRESHARFFSPTGRSACPRSRWDSPDRIAAIASAAAAAAAGPPPPPPPPLHGGGGPGRSVAASASAAAAAAACRLNRCSRGAAARLRWAGLIS